MCQQSCLLYIGEEAEQERSVGERQLTEGENRQGESDGVVLVSSEEEEPIAEPPPNKNVGEDPRSQVIRVHGNGTDPVQGDKVPGERATHGADMDEAWGGAVAEIGEAQVEEIDDEEEFGQPVVVAYPQVNEAKEQKIICDEVAPDVGCCGDVDGVGGIEGIRVEELDDEEDNPVDGGDDAALSKRRGVVVLPEPAVPRMAVVVAMAVLGRVEAVVEGGDEQEQIGHGRGDLVQENGARREVVATRERVQAVAVAVRGSSRLRHGDGGRWKGVVWGSLCAVLA